MAFAGRTLSLSVLAILLLGAAPARTDLHRFIDAMRAVSGEPFRYHITSTSVSQVEGLNETARTDVLGLQYNSRVCQGELCTGNYFDGTLSYGVTINNTALASSATPAKFIRALRIVNSGYFLAPDFEPAMGKLTDLGTMPAAGKTYRAIGVNGKDATPLMVLVDPQTHLIAYVRDWKGGYDFHYSDYRKTGSLMLPYAVDESGQNQQRYTSRAITQEPFLPPRGIAAESTGPSTLAMSGTTPAIPCTFAGLRRRCLIDTGNSGVAISKELAETLGLTPIGEFEVHGLGRYATEVVRGGPLVIGSKTFAPANYVVLHDIHQNGYDLVLGADILTETVVAIDYAAKQITIDPVDLHSATEMQLGFINFVPVVPVLLGSTAALLAVDTGDESTINLSYNYYREHPDLFSATDARGVTGVGGTSEELLGQIDRVQLGEFRVESQTIGATKLLQATGEGHLGAGFLSHFRVVLDYPRGRLGLTPRAGDPAVK
jgi:hypothetical protein